MRRYLALGLLLLAPVPVRGNGDFQVNTSPGVGGGPSVAKSPVGDYLVAWGSLDVWTRRFGPDGLALGPQLQVSDPCGPECAGNTHTSTERFPNGGYLVAWSDLVGLFLRPASTTRRVAPILPIQYFCNAYYRLLLPDGQPAGPQVHLGLEESSSLWCETGFPATVTQPDGSGVIVYQQGFPFPLPTEIHTLRFPSQGNLPLVLSASGSAPSVAVGPSGELAIAWSGTSGSGTSVLVRLFAPDGTPQGPEIVVSTEPGGRTAVGFSPAGNFVVAWDASTPSTTSYDVFARRYALDGTPLGPQFQVNTFTAGLQLDPEMTTLPDGGFLISWTSEGSYGPDGDGRSIQTRRYLPDGTPAGPEEQVNTKVDGDQVRPDVGVDASGTPTYVWASEYVEVRASDDRTDVGVTVTDNATTTAPGATLQYVVTVTNLGPADAPGTLVTNVFPAAVSCTWTCTGTFGASCAGGTQSGDIADSAFLPLGGVATYTAACLVAPDAQGTLLDTASVGAPPGLTDTNPGNDTATDTTDVVGLVVDDVAVDEGNAGSVLASASVRLLSPMSSPVSVNFATSDGTATSGIDYLPASGTLSFAPGETLLIVDVAVLGDAIFETDETFVVTLGNAAGAAIVDGLGVATILNDDSALPSGSLSELVHGSSEVRSLASAPGPAAVAQYWSLRQEPGSSYEAVVDGVSGDLGHEGPALERVASDGTIVQRAVGAGASRSLRWASAGAVVDERIRVQSRGCVDDCDAADVFRIRMWETTGSMARFNNSATQVTVVLLQNPGAEAAAGSLGFYGQDGTLLWQEPFDLLPGATLAVNSSGIPALQGQAGSIRVASDAPYGALQGKAVAVEPATGFTFDTPLVPRLR